MQKDNTVFLMPGDIYFSNSNEFVMTVLGSCVSVVFYDKKSKYTGVSHCLLPTNSLKGKNNDDNIFKYVDETIDYMIEDFSNYGLNKENFEIKLFGGSTIFFENSNIDIGTRNVKMAKEKLMSNGLEITKDDTGGKYSRKIIVNVNTGDVFLKKLV